MTQGKYIVIEGHDGTGKSSQLSLIKDKLAAKGIDSVTIEEPAGTPFTDALRSVIKNGDLVRNPTSDLLLFTAARLEINEKIITPNLQKGTWVLASRNWISTVAYQGYGHGQDIDLIKKLTQDYTDDQYLHPDFLCVLSLEDEAERTKRIELRGELQNPDRFESLDDTFQSRVKEGYLNVARESNLPIIDASPSIEQVAETIWSQLVGLTD